MGQIVEDVDQEANKWFKNLYDSKITVTDLVEKMKEF